MDKETNVFPITNLKDLSANYRLLEVIGLRSTGDDYDSNIQFITKKLSFSLRHPVIVIHRDNVPYLVVKDNQEILEAIPNEGFEAKKGEYVYFQDTGESQYIDFESQDPSEKQIILRFLQFDISGEIRKDNRLWQPRTGDAFFSKNTYNGNNRDVDIFDGFLARVVELPSGGYGISVDITKKYVSRKPLKAQLSKNEFNHIKRNKKRLIYRYGKTWFEIKPDELSPLGISRYRFKRGDTSLTLLEDIRQVYNGSMPPGIAKLADSASVLIYRNKNADMQPKGAVAAMCYITYDTEDYEVRGLHRKSIIAPFYRRRKSRIVAKKFLSNLKFGNTEIKLSSNPLKFDLNTFKMPNLRFNNEVILGCENSEKSNITVSKERFGSERKKLLLSSEVGFFTNSPFMRQYILIPETIYNSFANEKYFLKDLSNMVDRMHPTDAGWKPEIIPYDDRNKTNSLDIGFEILSKLRQKISMINRAYAVVILPSHLERDKKMHDETAALVVSESLSDFNVMTSIMHTKTLNACFGHREVNGEVEYFIKSGERGRFQKLYERYLFGVAINQVLLNNERWPFILADPLHADLIVGIDVKEHIAGFTFIDKYSQNILPTWDKSQSKEKLTEDQVSRMLVNHIQVFAENSDDPLRNIAIHRDGRVFKSEIQGVKKAIDHLILSKVLPEDVSINIVEIPKSSKVPFRIYEVVNQFDIWEASRDNGEVLNPSVGTYLVMNEEEAYVCTTGREFNKKGTSKPLYVKFKEGGMSFGNILEDIYKLSCLTYTKPDDCSRNPITISMTDRRINLLGSTYNTQKIGLMKSIQQ